MRRIFHFYALVMLTNLACPNRNHFVVAEDGEFTTDRGTSGAVPTIGAIITLINDARIHAGKKPVGEPIVSHNNKPY